MITAHRSNLSATNFTDGHGFFDKLVTPRHAAAVRAQSVRGKKYVDYFKVAT
jgi:hypothetical protein